MGRKRLEPFGSAKKYRFNGDLIDEAGSDEDDSDYVPDQRDDHDDDDRPKAGNANGKRRCRPGAVVPPFKVKVSINKTSDGNGSLNQHHHQDHRLHHLEDDQRPLKGDGDVQVPSEDGHLNNNSGECNSNNNESNNQTAEYNNESHPSNHQSSNQQQQQPSPTVASIKIKKNMKVKNQRSKKVNWAIVSDEDEDEYSDVVRPAKVKKKRGRKPGTKMGPQSKKPKFLVTDADGDGSCKPKRQRKRKSPSADAKTDAADDRRSDESSSKSLGGGEAGGGNKPVGSYTFRCLNEQVGYELPVKLPVDVCIKIFAMVLDNEANQIQELIKLSQVAESWRQIISSSPILWRCLDLGHYYADLDTLHQLAESGLFSCVRELNFANWNGHSAEALLALLAAGADSENNIKSICLKNCKYISTNILRIIVAHCQQMESLDLSGITNGVHSPSTNIFSSQIWRPFLEQCGRKLRQLVLAENSMPTFSSCLSTIMEYCGNLQVLDLCNVESISKSSTIPIHKLQESCPQLRVLRAANVTLTVSSSAVAPVGFAHLEELSIPCSDSGIAGVITTAHTDDVFEELTKSSEKLKLLDIRGSRLITPRVLVKLPAWNIQLLSLSNCPRLYTDQLGLAFSKWHSSLVDVDLSWNVNENSVVSCLKSLCDAGDESQLRSIQLRGSAVPYEHLKQLLESCTRLETIDLQSCRGLPRGIKRTFSGREFQALREEVMLGRYD